MVRLAQTMHLSCTDTNTVLEWKGERFKMTHVTQEFHRVRPKWFLSLWYVWRKSCTYLGSRLAQYSNRPSFHLSLATFKYHQVCPIRFLSRWYVWQKLCTYLALTLTLNPTQKEVRFRMTPVTYEFHQERSKWFMTLWYTRHKPCTYLASRLAQSPKGPKWASTWASSHSGTIRWTKTIYEPMVRLGNPCTYLALTLTLFPNKKRDATWPMSRRGSVRCVQNDFRTYGTFDANRAPILRGD
jgi:hypothetical protein